MTIDQLRSMILKSKSLDDLKLRIREQRMKDRIREQRMKDRIQQAADDKWEAELYEVAMERRDVEY